MKLLLVGGILSLAFILRIYGINWDQHQHLHPDERFLTMVATDIKMPQDLLTYFNPQISTLNPYNTQYKFFVYGTLPLTLNKISVTILNKDNYNDITLFGRLISALADSAIIIFIYLICLLWERKKYISPQAKYLAAFFYGIAVLPIQLSHFFAVDTFLSLFMTASFYFFLSYYYQQKIKYLLAGGIFFGLALGSKISAVFIAPLLFLLFIIPLIKKRQWLKIITDGLIFVILAYVTLRTADPKFFADGNFFSPLVNPQFLNNLKELNNLSGKDSWFPPAIQWMSKKPVLFALQNIALYGLGLPYFFLTLAGIIVFLKKRRLEFFILFFWVTGFFLYQSVQFTPSLRYFIFLYPFFAIFAAMGLSFILKIKSDKIRIAFFLLLGTGTIIWPLAFIHIYSQNHSRVTASSWMHKNIPENSFLAEEHWDDALPLNLPDIPSRPYQIVQMPVFGPDDEEKWKQIEETLTKADYYIITSNRAYGSIMAVPSIYPKMASFYEKLFAGKTEFKLVKEFTSYPELDLGIIKIPINDDYAEEAFTVYDHPKVLIYKKR